MYLTMVQPDGGGAGGGTPDGGARKR
jgi:hypothetical protein